MTGSDRHSWTSTDSDRHGQTSVTLWSLIWVGMFLVADFAIGRGWVHGSVGVIAITAAVTLVGAGWIHAYVRFSRHVDELMRKILLDAVAMALGSGFVAGFALLLLESGDLVRARPSQVLVAMVIVYIVVVVIGLRRFGYTKQ